MRVVVLRCMNLIFPVFCTFLGLSECVYMKWDSLGSFGFVCSTLSGQKSAVAYRVTVSRVVAVDIAACLVEQRQQQTCFYFVYFLCDVD